jgi:4-oxalocrotonate tautomerase family enzyme
MLGGKSAEEKRNLVRGITNAVVKALGVEPGKVTIFLKEYGAQDIGKGGNLYGEIGG